MLENRDYMRSDYRPGGRFKIEHPVTWWIMGSLFVVYLFQLWDWANCRNAHVENLLLSLDGMSRGYFWELVTFQFLHANLLHLGFNLLGLWMFGRWVEERLGRAHFLKIYFLGGLAGGILQMLLATVFPTRLGASVLGASAGIFALTAAFSTLEPDAMMLFFFVIPMRAINLLYGSIAFCVICIICAVLQIPFFIGMAHGAHLGGILFAMGYMRWGLHSSGLLAGWKPWRNRTRESLHSSHRQPSSKVRFETKSSTPSPGGEANEDEFMSHEVDPILDKISAHGIQSLSDRERKILQAARARMSKR
jgi:membrane associated rhomboid family serine protease